MGTHSQGAHEHRTFYDRGYHNTLQDHKEEVLTGMTQLLYLSVLYSLPLLPMNWNTNLITNQKLHAVLNIAGPSRSVIYIALILFLLKSPFPFPSTLLLPPTSTSYF